MKLIVDISDNLYNVIKSDKYGLHKGKMYDIIRNGIPLDEDLESLRAEVRAYFNGQAYGWEQGRKALIEEVKAEIENRSYGVANESVIQGEMYERRAVLEIIDKHIDGESEEI